MTDIRLAGLHDLPGAYRVCLQTGDAGRDATGRYRDPDLLGHVYVGPYIVGQPDVAFILADDEGVAGYCLAARDTRAFEAWAEAHWWPRLREQHPLSDDSSPDGELIRVIHAPPRAGDVVIAGHPAHLHIDLMERARGRGHGRLLLERQLAALRRGGAAGVHLEVAAENDDAMAFYRHLGFVELDRLADAVVLGLPLT